MLYGLRPLSATRALRVKLIGVSLEEGGVTSSSRRVETARQSAVHENVFVKALFVLQRQGGGSVRGQRMNALAAAKENGRGAPSVIAAACLAQASASSLRTIPWWPEI